MRQASVDRKIQSLARECCSSRRDHTARIRPLEACAFVPRSRWPISCVMANPSSIAESVPACLASHSTRSTNIVANFPSPAWVLTREYPSWSIPRGFGSRASRVRRTDTSVAANGVSHPMAVVPDPQSTQAVLIPAADRIPVAARRATASSAAGIIVVSYTRTVSWAATCGVLSGAAVTTLEAVHVSATTSAMRLAFRTRPLCVAASGASMHWG